MNMYDGLYLKKDSIMLRKNKTISLLIAISMMISALSGCGRKDGAENTTEPVENTAAAVSDNADAPTEIIDMNDPGNDEYGKLYYAPVDEAHIAGDDYIKYSDNEILIVVNDGVTEEQVRDLAVKYNSEIVGAIEVSGDYQLKLAKSATREELEDLMEQIKGEDIIDSATLNYVSEISATNMEKLNGFYYGEKWQDDLQDYDDIKGKSWGIEAINTMGAWQELRSTSFPVKVGVIDNGFDPDHDDLKFVKVFYDHGENGMTSTENKHGTHVAGIMAARTNDTTGICGVYPYGEGYLFGVSSGSDHGYSENGNYRTTVMGMKISYAELIVRNVKVINHSEGFNWHMYDTFKYPPFELTNYPLLKAWWDDPSVHEQLIKEANVYGDFLNRMLKKGYDFVIIAAAGNDSDPSIGHLDCNYASWNNLIRREDYPDVFDRIIVVGAVDSDLNITSYSNGGDRVDIYAPGGIELGQQIYSTIPQNDYGYLSGTSMAAPHVAGVAAMVWTANNQLTGATVKRIIKNSLSTRCTSCNLIDAQKAVKSAYQTSGTGHVAKPHNGMAEGYVVERFQEEKRIADATVIMENIETGELVTQRDAQTGEEVYPKTDKYGHFEIVAPEGKYTLHAIAEGYTNYDWPGGDKYPTPIEIKDEEINYLDWVKMWTRGKDNIIFGSYEQDGINVNGDEPIEWMVLDENENGLLLISRYVLDVVPYNSKEKNVTWETCTLRTWLNHDFLNSAFTKEEKSYISEVNIANNDNEYSRTDGGNDTEDMIFCLSVDEMTRYFECDDYDPEYCLGWYQSLLTEATEYARTKGVGEYSITSENYNNYSNRNYTSDCIGLTGASWWLRTPGAYGNDCTCLVQYDGYAGANFCTGVINKTIGVRPVLYLNLSGDELEKLSE